MSIKLVVKHKIFIPIIISLLFFLAYSTLSIIRHENYQSYGYDLGINDQVVWRYSHFQLPLTTIDPFPDEIKLAEHVELVFAIISPSYWIYSSPITLILVRNAWFCFSSLAVFLLARKKQLNYFLCFSLVISYLGFFGVQYAIWTDVHSNSFAAGLLMWFVYFLSTKRKKMSILFFILALTAKENIGLATFFISFIFFLKERSRIHIFFMSMSVIYVSFIFLIFFPYILQVKYLYANKEGILSNLNLINLFDTHEKRQVIFYSLLSFGFIPLLSPLYLLPAVVNLAMYFVVASQLSGSHGLYGHYRIGLSVFLAFATIYSIAKHKRFNNRYVGLYLIICTMIVQYILHLPLSYLTKEWFWTAPKASQNINTMIKNYLPPDASVVSQNNIVPHISQRDKIYSLYPEWRSFSNNSPCGNALCSWFRWHANPEFLIVDTSNDWDVRHLLIDRPVFLEGLKNLEKAKIITIYKKIGDTSLYKVNQNPKKYK